MEFNSSFLWWIFLLRILVFFFSFFLVSFHCLADESNNKEWSILGGWGDKIFSILSNVMCVCSIDKNRWMNDSYMVRWNVVNELEKEIQFLQEKLARSNRVVKYLKEENEQLRSYFGDVMECEMVQMGVLNEAPY